MQKRKVSSIFKAVTVGGALTKSENIRIRHTRAQAASTQSRFKNFRAAHGAALWSLLFAAVHAAWAAGWYVGLPAEQARKAFQQTWFWTYNFTVAVLCGLGVIVALTLVRPLERRLARKVLNTLAMCGTGLLFLRGGAGVTKTIYLTLVAGRDALNLGALWDAWFCLGAVLFSLAIRQSRLVNNS